MKNAVETLAFVGGCLAAYFAIVGIQAGDHVLGGWGLRALLALAE